MFQCLLSFALDQALVPLFVPAVDQALRVGEGLGLPLAARIDDQLAGNLVQPGAKVSAVELVGKMLPGPAPDLLVQVFAILRTNAGGNIGQQ